MVEFQQGENIDEGEPPTVKTSQAPDGDEQQDLPKDKIDATKEAYQVETEFLSGDESIDVGEKDNPDDEDFTQETPFISDNDDDDMESDENVQRGHKRKNQG